MSTYRQNPLGKEREARIFASKMPEWYGCFDLELTTIYYLLPSSTDSLGCLDTVNELNHKSLRKKEKILEKYLPNSGKSL